MEGWVVLQAQTDGDGDGWLWIAATPFLGEGSLERAKEFLEHVVRDEWGTEFPGEGDQLLKLADHKGVVYPEGSSISGSDMYYDEDGMEAWESGDQGNGYARKICIVKMGEEGERICSNS